MRIERDRQRDRADLAHRAEFLADEGVNSSAFILCPKWQQVSRVLPRGAGHSKTHGLPHKGSAGNHCDVAYVGKSE